MKNSAWYFKALIISLLNSVGAPTVSFAALEEVIVTAQKREENIQEVPIAVTAFTAASMEKKGLTNISQIGDFTPNVEMDNTSPFAGSSSVLSPFIRGIGQNDFAFNLEPGVGVYVDGIYFARTIGAVVDLLDLDHIEVLKGPQGTLFGRNTIGGALNIITRRPSEEFTWKGEVTTGSDNRLDVRGSVDLPLIEGKLLSQVAFSSKNRDGYQKRITYPGSGTFRTETTSTGFLRAANEFGGDQGDENQDNIRGKLLWIVNDDVEVTLTGDYMHVDEHAPALTLLDTFAEDPAALSNLYNACISLPRAVLDTIPTSPATTLGTVCNTPIAGTGAILGGANFDADPTNDRYLVSDDFIPTDIDTTYAAGGNFSKIDSWGIAGTIDWDINAMHLKSITAYRGLLALMGSDQTGAPFNIGDPSFDTKQNQFSQELQLSGRSFEDKLNWLAGFYYFFEDGDLTDYVIFNEGLAQVFGRNFFENEAWALFTHLNFAMTDRLSFTAGLRYTDEDKQFEGQQKDLNALPSKLGFPAFLHPDPTDLTRLYPLGVQNKSFTDLSTRFGAEFRFTDDIFGYLSYSEGFKTGGWTTRLLVPEIPDPNKAPEFDEETATSYEVGMKTTLFDQRLQLNMAGFYTEYEDIQVTVQKGVSPTFANGGSGEILGFEAEFVFLATDNFVINGSLGYMDAEFNSIDPFAGSVGLDLNDKFVNTPDWSMYLGGEYTIPMNNGGELAFRVDYSYKDDIANDAVNTDLLMAPEVHIVNAAATYTAPGENWEVTVGGRNITDERYIYGGFRQPGIGWTSGNYSRPAEWYLTLRYSQ
jgi:iron complex outermembrane receptor protein